MEICLELAKEYQQFLLTDCTMSVRSVATTWPDCEYDLTNFFYSSPLKWVLVIHVRNEYSGALGASLTPFPLGGK